MDLIPDELKEEKIEEYKEKVLNITDKKDQLLKIFGTTLWNETLYIAWSVIIQYILPDIK